MRHFAIRPSQFATLLLAARDSLPRARARDQQADLAGDQLRRRLLQRIVDLDPEPQEWSNMIQGLIEEFGEPQGPTRAIARMLQEEWGAASQSPQLTQWILDQAFQSDSESRQ